MAIKNYLAGLYLGMGILVSGCLHSTEYQRKDVSTAIIQPIMRSYEEQAVLTELERYDNAGRDLVLDNAVNELFGSQCSGEGFKKYAKTNPEVKKACESLESTISAVNEAEKAIK